ncbi:MAG TPA: serine--tRNA ligase [Solirubrobacteraceae bacterium]|nr:serine--tRNA ligase [Solirubrobacteraceae bacterium]
MIDVKAARADPERFRAALARRGGAADLDALLELDRRRVALLPQVEELRARRKIKGKPTPEQIEEGQRIKAQLEELDRELGEATAQMDALLARIPNLPDDSAPDGDSEEDAEVVKTVGDPPRFGFEPKDALELSAGGIDVERAARMAGSRFAYRLGDVARTELALYRFVIDRLVAKGFVPVLPPVIANERAMFGTGALPSDESNYYRLEGEDQYLTGTSEVALAALHMDDRIEEDDLPLLYTAFSTNFRREAGAAGRDTRGMFRMHQFDKVEMFVFCRPEESAGFHEQLLANEEEIVQALELPYRVVNIAVGDLGAPAAKKYDIEAWFPTQERYREVTSCSNTTDYQSRRLNIRARIDGRLVHVHTLNGTGTTARSLLAVMENHQQEDGSVAVPQVLQDHGAPAGIGTA